MAPKAIYSHYPSLGGKFIAKIESRYKSHPEIQIYRNNFGCVGFAKFNYREYFALKY